MVHLCARNFSQLRVGPLALRLVLGLALGSDHGVVVQQKDEAGPVGSVSFRLVDAQGNNFNDVAFYSSAEGTLVRGA